MEILRYNKASDTGNDDMYSCVHTALFFLFATLSLSNCTGSTNIAEQELDDNSLCSNQVWNNNLIAAIYQSYDSTQYQCPDSACCAQPPGSQYRSCEVAQQNLKNFMNIWKNTWKCDDKQFVSVMKCSDGQYCLNDDCSALSPCSAGKSLCSDYGEDYDPGSSCICGKQMEDSCDNDADCCQPPPGFDVITCQGGKCKPKPGVYCNDVTVKC